MTTPTQEHHPSFILIIVTMTMAVMGFHFMVA